MILVSSLACDPHVLYSLTYRFTPRRHPLARCQSCRSSLVCHFISYPCLPLYMLRVSPSLAHRNIHAAHSAHVLFNRLNVILLVLNFDRLLRHCLPPPLTNRIDIACLILAFSLSALLHIPFFCVFLLQTSSSDVHQLLAHLSDNRQPRFASFAGSRVTIPSNASTSISQVRS